MYFSSANQWPTDRIHLCFDRFGLYDEFTALLND